MEALHPTTKLPEAAARFKNVSLKKSDGATYTPTELADFVAEQILVEANLQASASPFRMLDPALGDGQLLISLLRGLKKRDVYSVSVFGFDTNSDALRVAKERINIEFPEVAINLKHGDFLEHVLENYPDVGRDGLFVNDSFTKFDLIIANPPYVRTQVMGAETAQKLAERFQLKGRVDLYHAFLLGMAQVLKPTGTAGIIVSNRFMTTRGGDTLRQELRNRFNLRHIWDLGDTKLFDAAVLPAVLIITQHEVIDTKASSTNAFI